MCRGTERLVSRETSRVSRPGRAHQAHSLCSAGHMRDFGNRPERPAGPRAATVPSVLPVEKPRPSREHPMTSRCYVDIHSQAQPLRSTVARARLSACAYGRSRSHAKRVGAPGNGRGPRLRLAPALKQPGSPPKAKSGPGSPGPLLRRSSPMFHVKHHAVLVSGNDHHMSMGILALGLRDKSGL